MCDLCIRIKKSANYRSVLSSMHERDQQCLENSKKFVSTFSSLFAYSTIEYPKLLIQPMFEPRMAAATATNYFQPLFINSEKIAGGFSAGSTRAVFFLGNRLMLISKSVAQNEAKDFFTTFLLAHFEPDEYSFEITPEKAITISVEKEKAVKNLITEKVENIKIEFTFTQDNLEGKVAQKSSPSKTTIGEYIVRAQHFSPHPYMLKLGSEFGYAEPVEFQKHSFDYFNSHFLKKKE